MKTFPVRRTKTSGPNRRTKELPVCVSEVSFFEDQAWIKTGFDLIKEMAPLKRDYLVPRMRPDMASFEKKMAGYGDAVVATAAVLAKVGLPSAVQGYWTEHSERSVLPTALAILGVTDSEKDILGWWKPEGSDTYVRSYGGREATGQVCPSRPEGTTDTRPSMRERLQPMIDWLQDRRKLGEEAARAIVDPLAHHWKHGRILTDVVTL